MKLSRDWGFKIETFRKPPSANFSLMQKIRETLKANSGPIVVKQDSSIINEIKVIPFSKGKNSPQTNDSVTANQRTRSHTPVMNRPSFPAIYDKDYMTKFGNQSGSKSDFMSDLQSVNQEQTLMELSSPIKIIASRRSSPERFERPSQICPRRGNLDTTMNNQDSTLPNLAMASQQADVGRSERGDDSLISVNNTIPISATKVLVSNKQRDLFDFDFLNFHKNPEQDISIEKSVISNGNRLRKMTSLDDEGKSKWGKLSKVMRSIMLLKRQETKQIGDEKAINNEIDSYNVRKWKNPDFKEVDITTRENSKDAFDLVRRVQAFCECVMIGSQKHIEIMKQILAEDPKKYLYESDDPSHLINKKNHLGHTPLYIAAKNGNVNVVRVLIENKANHNILSQVSQSAKDLEAPLQVAVRWSHEGVVSFMLENCDFDYKILKSCVKLSSNSNIRSNIQKHIKERYRRRSTVPSCFRN